MAIEVGAQPSPGVGGIPTKYIIIGAGVLGVGALLLWQQKKTPATAATGDVQPTGSTSAALSSVQQMQLQQFGELTKLFAAQKDLIGSSVGGLSMQLDTQAGALGSTITGVGTTLGGQLQSTQGVLGSQIGGIGSALTDQVAGANASLSKQLAGVGSSLADRLTGVSSGVSDLSRQSAQQYGALADQGSFGLNTILNRSAAQYDILARGIYQTFRRASDPSWMPGGADDPWAATPPENVAIGAGAI